MRCPSCGTDNAPDSRFCGGCGARFSVSNQRVAPTHKITDDAPFPQRPPGAATPITAPGVVPPRMISAPPHGAPYATGIAPVPAVRPVTPLPEIAIGPGFTATPAAPPGVAAAPPATRPRGNRGPAAQGREPHDEPSLSLPVPARRPWGRIAVVLAIDVVLAIGGAYLLREGLAGASGTDDRSPPALRPQ